MKLTKKRLKDHVSVVEARVITEINRDSYKEIKKVRDAYWNTIDPDFKLLKTFMKNENAQRKSKNDLISLCGMKNITTFGMYSKDEQNDFEKFKEIFFDRVKIETIPGVENVKKKYGEERNSVHETYRAIKSNLDKMTAKKGLEYLKELGMEVERLEEVESQVPMIVIDKSKLRLPKQEEG